MRYDKTYWIVPLLLLALTIFFFVSFFSVTVHYFLGLVLAIVGIILWYIGKLTLGDAFSPKIRANKLVIKGIYSKIRHPLYIGFSFLLFGWSLFMFDWVVFIVACVIMIMLFVKARLEEKVLFASFGSKYTNYKKKTWF